MPSSPSPRSSPRSAPAKPVAPSILPDRTAAAPPADPSRSSASFFPAWRRPTLDENIFRRPSVQFVPQIKTDGASPQTSRSSSAQPIDRKTRPSLVISGAAGGTGGRRMSSPPPPAQFRPSVSFDTFSNKEASDFSLTLNRKHRDYEYTRRSRTFLCGTDTNEYSDTALEWLIDELVDDGDEVVCLRVVEKDSREAVKWAGGMGEKGYRKEAERFLEAIEKKNTEDRAISLVLEFSVGKVHDTIQQMIRIYEPAILVVGTRGRSLTGYQGLLSSGSVSKYCLQYSPVPVIVVRPSSKREAKKRKRLRDPSRTGYRDILDKSEDAPRGRGGHLLDAQNRMSVVGSTDLGALGELGSAGDPDHEARMVAEAVGYRERNAQQVQHRAGSTQGPRSSLTRITSAEGDTTLSPRDQVPKSPNLDSPLPSDDELDDADEEDIGRLDEETLRPEDEAAILAYERAQEVFREEQEEAEERTRRMSERSASRGRGGGSRNASRNASKSRDEEGGGSAVLGLLAQLDRGMK
ncbi:hypothetical protein LTR37_014620 [Vermiconidia calcicola]|uniref:Uncharacterized protein n=1 Tax=Vermiconidia calcicola TaxID=1690605 RepID=A0ACC3MUH6_9PEZI|nr:hypothetical protein LTR37_014620 [Vermiconidia calcicola]